jgi:hypothetical protein
VIPATALLDLGSVAATLAGLVTTFPVRDRRRRLATIVCDVLMLLAMVDTAPSGAGLLAPVGWAAILLAAALTATAWVARDRVARDRPRVLHALGMIVMAGLLVASSSSSSSLHAAAAHVGHDGATGALVSAAVMAYVLATAVSTVRGVVLREASWHPLFSGVAVALMGLACIL